MSLKWGLIGSHVLQATSFFWTPSLTSWLNQGVTFLPLFATPSRFRPYTRAADEATGALNSCHSTSASAVHSVRFWNNDDRMPSRLCLHICVGPVWHAIFLWMKTGTLQPRALLENMAVIVKSQQWPTPSESIAIYCVRKLVSCVTHLQSCAQVDIWNTKKNYVLLLRSKLKK